jgi:Tol biopolymer transport system component
MSPLYRVGAVVVLLLSPADAAVPKFDGTVVRQGLSDVSGTSATVSADGALVAFVSSARLLPADRNSVDDIYVLDRLARTITLETRAADGASADGSSSNPQLNSDGHYLAFESWATNLTGLPDRDLIRDVFLRDRRTGTTTRVSVSHEGGDANGHSDSPAISGDGAVVAFVSSATNLVRGADANGSASDVYLLSVPSGQLIRAGVDGANRQYVSSISPRVSADGRLVVFSAIEQRAQRSRPASSPVRAVYLRDVIAAETTCISSGRDGAPQAAFFPDISADGQIVAFVLMNGNHTSRTDVAVHDRAASRTTVITRRANGRSTVPRVSADGRLVVFESWASNLLCDGDCPGENVDDNLLPDVYLFDRADAHVRRVSGGRQIWWAPSRSPAIDRHGTTIVFSSRHPFGPEDETIDFDLFVCNPICF